MHHIKTTKLLNYWNGLRNNRIAPNRFEIAPSDIGDLLPNTFILEKTGRSNMRFRLAGSQISDLYGRLLRGENFHNIWAEEDWQIISNSLYQACEHGTISTIDYMAHSQSGDELNFQMLLLPLAHVDQKLERIVGSLHPIEDCHIKTPTHYPIKPQKINCVHLSNYTNKHQPMPNEDVPCSPVVPENSRIVQRNNLTFRIVEGGK